MKKWTPEEDRRMREMAADRLSSIAVAHALGRTHHSVKGRARNIGVQFNPRIWKRPERNPDVSTWTAADRLSEWADVPQALAELVIQTCEARYLAPKLVRSDDKRRDLVRCRNEIARAAREQGFSYPLIARALNRDHTTIMYAVKVAA